MKKFFKSAIFLYPKLNVTIDITIKTCYILNVMMMVTIKGEQN